MKMKGDLLSFARTSTNLVVSEIEKVAIISDFRRLDRDVL